MIVTYIKTLIWCDCPIVFISKNIDGYYICILAEKEEDNDFYIAVKVFYDLLESISLENIGLREVFLNKENKKYSCKTNIIPYLEESMELLEDQNIDPKYIPLDGAYCKFDMKGI